MAQKPPPVQPTKREKRRAILLGALAGLALWAALVVGLARPWLEREPEGVHRFDGTAFAGTPLEAAWIVRIGLDADLPDADRSAVAAALAAALAAVEADVSPAATSEISRLNAHPSADPLPLSPSALAALLLAYQAGALSGGAFDVTLGPAEATWAAGLDEEARDPLPAEIALLMARVGIEKLAFDLSAGVASKQRPDLEVDLAPLAPGLAADAVADALAAAGFARYRVEIGGCVRAAGSRPDGVPWHADLPGPAPGADPVRIDVRDTALCTWRLAEGSPDDAPRLDPRTGRPVDNAVDSATVLHPQAAWAAALAHALRVLGPVEGAALAEQQGLAAILRVRGDGGASEERRSREMEAYLQPPPPPPAQ